MPSRPEPAAPAADPSSGPWSALERPPLRVEALRRALVAPGGPFTRLDVLAATASTNGTLADLVAGGGVPDLSVLTTDHQTAGRGRLDRTWTTPARSSLAVSVLLRPGTAVATARWSWLPLLAGVAVTEALREVAGVPARLKWPNDVLVESDGPSSPAGKVSGILAELVATPEGQAVVVGFGVNVSQSRDELPVPSAASLRTAGAATTDRDTVLRACLRALASRYLQWTAAGGDAVACGLAATARELCSTLGREVAIELPGGRTPLTGTAEGLDDNGRLLVRSADGGLHEVAAGDVVHVRPAAPGPQGAP